MIYTPTRPPLSPTASEAEKQVRAWQLAADAAPGADDLDARRLAVAYWSAELLAAVAAAERNGSPRH